MAEPAKPLIEKGTVLTRRYRLDELIDDSALAEVWRAHDLILDRQVIVKVLHRNEASDELIDRFRAEAISAAQLSHPNIVPTFDAGLDDEVAFMVSGYIEGTMLSSVVETGALPLDITLSIGIQVADALEHAHQAQLVHRDVKPSRLLVVDDEYRVMLTDFGVATAVTDLPETTTASEAMSKGVGADVETDIAAMGRLIHTVGCGEDHGFSACKTLPPAIIEILAKTSGDSNGCYESSSELKSDLEFYFRALNKSPESKTIRRVRISPPVAPRVIETPRSADAPLPPPEPVDDSTQAVPVSQWSSGDETAQHQAVAAPPPFSGQGAPVAQPPRSRAETVRTEGEQRSRRRRVVTAGVIAAFILVAIVFGRLLSTSVGSESETSATPTTEAPMAVSARSFDPLGDGRENEPQVPLAVDNDPTTAWTTERYNTRRFGNLKAGVGLIIQPGTAGALRSLEVTASGSAGWSAEIYVADSPKEDLAAWGEPVDTQSGLGDRVGFDLRSAQGGAVLLWITDLGAGNRLSIAEAEIRS